MDNNKRFLVETNLIKAIATFHDCDNKEKREKYVREYFLEFCNKNNINQSEALEMVEKFLEDRRKKSIFKYEHFQDLKFIIYPENKDSNENNINKKDVEVDDER